MQMMRVLSVFLAVWIAIQTCGFLPATAAVQVTTERTADGLKGEVHLNKVGALLFSEGLGEMTGSTMEIKGRLKGQEKPIHLLGGVIYKVSNVNNRITANVFFNEGPGLPALTALNCDERVELKDGSTQPGPIQQVSPTEVTASGRTIPMDAVNKIHSNRAFVIHAIEGQAGRLHLEPTCEMAAAPPKHKFLTKRNLIIGAVAATIITLAITLPIVLTGGGGGGGNENATAQGYYFNTHPIPPPLPAPQRPPSGGGGGG